MNKEIKVGFFKKPQGIFTEKLIKEIEAELSACPRVKLFSDLDFTKFYVKNGRIFLDNFDVSSLDVYFWHDTVKPSEWLGDNYFLNVLKVLENNCIVINSSDSTRITNDKFLAHSLLKKNGLPVADFALVNPENKDALKKVFEDFDNSVLIKPRFGGWGLGISKIDSFESLLNTIEAIKSFLPCSHWQLFLEKFYKNDISRWTSVVVIGEKVLFGYRKKLSENSDWKIYDPEKKDGTGEKSDYVDPEESLKKISLEAKKIIGKDIIGFDFIHTRDGYKIIDENSRPGLYKQCLKKAGIDIKKEIVDLIFSKFPQD